jgi:hypothetical protein
VRLYVTPGSVPGQQEVLRQPDLPHGSIA